MHSIKKLSPYCIFLVLLTFLTSKNTYSQSILTPLPYREVNGTVIDSTKLGVIGATVILTSVRDTLKTITSKDGSFKFNQVKSATYTIFVTSIGYESSKAMRYVSNNALIVLTLDPIVLKEDQNILNEVVINGTPSITYKTDTVEYKASDYTVRQNKDGRNGGWFKWNADSPGANRH
jgi:hypothetical protein